jgi:hypothetical protein
LSANKKYFGSFIWLTNQWNVNSRKTGGLFFDNKIKSQNIWPNDHCILLRGFFKTVLNAGIGIVYDDEFINLQGYDWLEI